MFVFECEYQYKNDAKNCLIMFLGQYSDTENFKNSLYSQIQTAYRDNLTPDAVILLFPDYLSEKMQGLMKDESIVIELTRHKYSGVQLYNFNDKGEFKLFKNVNTKGSIPDFDFAQLRKSVVESGYKMLMGDRAKDVLVKAPAGTNFVKPSGKVLEEFIYASQLARSSCEHQFIALSLLPYMPKTASIDCIYIDTSSIAAIAEALTYYISKFESSICKHVQYKSFSSYGGLEGSKPDNTDGAWIIISASESTNMGKKIVKDWGLNSDQVITILSHKSKLTENDVNIGNAVVFCISEYSSKDANNYSPVKVQVRGESFSVEASPPNEVLLLKTHKPLFIDNSVNKYRDNDVFLLNKSNNGITRGDEPFLIYVDYLKLRSNYVNCDCKTKNIACSKVKGDDLCSNSKLYQWMEQIVQWSVPRNLKRIIIGSSDVETRLLNDFQTVLAENEFDLAKIKAIEPDDHDDMSSLGSNSVLVLSNVISSGNSFVDVNRSLRLANHHGMRIFVTAFTTSPSRKRFSNFKVSVTQGSNGFKYAFFSYKIIYVGDKNNSSWKQEKKFITELITQNPECVGIDYWVERKRQLGAEGVGLQGKIGLSYQGINEKLEFAPDFVFWPSNYSVDSINLEAVYVTVASILQNLRDNSLKGVTLNSSIYQHSVMSPDNFIRFNDSALQSSLWRSCTPSELDYRRSDILSSDFQGVMTKIMSASGQRGYICLDLLIAIAIRWIKISDVSLKKIIADAEKHLDKPHAVVLVKHIKAEFNL
jgi:hypothetical protein